MRILMNVAALLIVGIVASVLASWLSGPGDHWGWTALPWIILAIFWTWLLRNARRAPRKPNA